MHKYISNNVFWLNSMLLIFFFKANIHFAFLPLWDDFSPCKFSSILKDNFQNKCILQISIKCTSMPIHLFALYIHIWFCFYFWKPQFWIFQHLYTNVKVCNFNVTIHLKVAVDSQQIQIKVPCHLHILTGTNSTIIIRWVKIKKKFILKSFT